MHCEQHDHPPCPLRSEQPRPRVGRGATGCSGIVQAAIEQRRRRAPTALPPVAHNPTSRRSHAGKQQRRPQGKVHFAEVETATTPRVVDDHGGDRTPTNAAGDLVEWVFPNNETLISVTPESQTTIESNLDKNNNDTNSNDTSQ